MHSQACRLGFGLGNYVWMYEWELLCFVNFLASNERQVYFRANIQKEWVKTIQDYLFTYLGFPLNIISLIIYLINHVDAVTLTHHDYQRYDSDADV